MLYETPALIIQFLGLMVDMDIKICLVITFIVSDN